MDSLAVLMVVGALALMVWALFAARVTRSMVKWIEDPEEKLQDLNGGRAGWWDLIAAWAVLCGFECAIKLESAWRRLRGWWKRTVLRDTTGRSQ